MDKFDTFSASLESPATDAFAVAPDDGTDFATISRALYVGGGGNLAVRMKDGASVTLKNVPGGSVLALRVKGVNATGTTATDIVGLA